MITFEDVKFYKSQFVDFYEDTKNGGMISNLEIVSGDVNNIFDETTATQRSKGIVKRAKIYIKNLTSDRKMGNTYFAISKDADFPDTVKLYEATKLPSYGFTFDEDVKSGTAAGTKIAFKDATPSGVDVTKFKGRQFQTGKQILTVDDVDSDNSKIWFKEATSADISSGDTAITIDDENTYESDIDWSKAKAYYNTPIVSVLNEGNNYCQIATSAANGFAAGDKVLIVDIYRRPMFRGVIDSIGDGDTDNMKKITFTTKYLNRTIPAREGYIANALNFDLGPGEHFGYWLELTIGASNALAPEAIGSYQLELTFDDVSAG